MNILYLDHGTDFSGGQRSLLALLSKLKSRTKDVNAIIVIDNKADRMKAQLSKLGFPVLPINFYNWNNKVLETLFLPITLLKLFILAKQKNIDLVHSNSFKAGLIGGCLGILLGKPSIFRARLGVEINNHGLLDYLVLRLNKKILANSFYVKETFIKRFGKGNESKLKVVYNPVIFGQELSNEKIDFFKAKFHLNPTYKYIGAIGRIESFKRLDELVKALDILVRNKSKYKVVFIGAPTKHDEGRYFRRLKDSVRELGLTDHVIFTMFVEDIAEITTCMDCVVLCTEGEPLSRGLFETQHLGVPVIASASGGNVELIEHKVTGLLYELGNPKDLAEKISLLFNDRILESDLRKNGMNFVKERFDDRNTVETELEVYKSL